MFTGVRTHLERHHHRPQRGEGVRERHRLGQAQSSRSQSTSGKTDGTRPIATSFQVNLAFFCQIVKDFLKGSSVTVKPRCENEVHLVISYI